MKNHKIPIISAVLTALLSTLCCLPAFLFIFFGISGGLLTYFTTLEYIRIPLGIISLFLFIYSLFLLNKKIKCECNKKTNLKNYIIIFIFIVSIFLLLFYPEILPYFMD